jgi:hypothetical protein
MAMTFFYVCVVLWVLALYLGDALASNVNLFFFLVFLALAVAALVERIDIAVRQIKDPDFDIAAHNRKGRNKAVGFFLMVFAAIVLITVGQGFVRCLLNDSPMSASCVWQGTQEQVTEDLD